MGDVVPGDQLCGGEPWFADGFLHGLRCAGREVPGPPQQVPGVVAAVALAPVPGHGDHMGAAVQDVIQEPARGQVRQRDPLGGQRDRHVRQRLAADRVRPDQTIGCREKAVQCRVSLADAEDARIAEEAVAAHGTEGRGDDPQGEQRGQGRGQRASGRVTEADLRHRPAGLIEPAGDPSLLPGLAAEASQAVQQSADGLMPAAPMMRPDAHGRPGDLISGRCPEVPARPGQLRRW